MNDVTIIDVAKLAGVSVATVSRVLNNHPDVSKKTREQVMSVISGCGYVPNNSAQNLKRESLKAVGVIIKGLSNPVFIKMLGIIQQELEANRYIMLLQQVEQNQDEVTAAISLCKEKKPRGLIFMGGNFKHTRDKLAMLDVPFVMLTMTMHKDIDRESFSSVTVDDYAAGYAVAERMINAGHKKLAAIGFSARDASVSRLRINGFRQCILDHGLNNGEDQIGYADGFHQSFGYAAAGELLKKVEFTALFCVSDMLALGAIRAIHDAALSVPSDISVVGFDGIDEGRYYIPSLATMKQPDQEMAYRSVRILLDCVKNNAACQHLLFNAGFTEGESFSTVG